MICCKIIFDYQNPQGDFKLLLEKLGSYGDVLWDQHTLYFSDTSGNITEQQIVSVIQSCKYSKIFIDSYDRNNQPNYENDYVMGWLTDHLMKISYNLCEQASQKTFQDISKGLDILNEQLDKQLSEQKNNI